MTRYLDVRLSDQIHGDRALDRPHDEDVQSVAQDEDTFAVERTQPLLLFVVREMSRPVEQVRVQRGCEVPRALGIARNLNGDRQMQRVVSSEPRHRIEA